MSANKEEKMEVDSEQVAEVEEKKGKADKRTEDDGPDASGDEESDEEDDTPKRPKTLQERRLSRLSAGMEMRGMMTESYNCKECSASFTRKSKLDFHIANAHPKEDPMVLHEPAKRGRKPKTPQKGDKETKASPIGQKSPKTPKSPKIPKTPKSPRTPKASKAQQQNAFNSDPKSNLDMTNVVTKCVSAAEIRANVNKVLEKNHQIAMTKQQNKSPKVTTISNEKVKYNWGYYCTACDMYFANMFAQQFHCLHGQAKFRCEACCICFKLRKNFMSHVQMVHGVDIPEEVLARMRPRSEIRAKQDADSEKTQDKEAQVIDLTKDDVDTKDQAKKPETGQEKDTGKSKDAVGGNSENQSSKVNQTKQGSNEVKDKVEPEVILVADSPKPKTVQDLKQSESGGNSSADESEKKDEGRVYLTTVRMGNTYVTLPSGEKWMIECLRCHQAFFKMEDASMHMKQKPGSEFTCPHCQYSSTLFSQCDYEIHRLRTHSFPCAQCRQSFILECQRDMHEQKIHNYFRQLMRKKPDSAQMKTHHGSHINANKRTVIIPGGTTVRQLINKDGYPISGKQRTPYVCVMCDRDCYTRDALEHHKRTFHAAVYRPNNKSIHPISKTTVIKHSAYQNPGLMRSNVPVSRMLEEMRQVPRGPSKLPLGANYAPAVNSTIHNPYLEPNKLPQAYITRLKVTLPEANKLVDDIRNELLKGPTNFAMPNYAKPSKFNKDMVTNPGVVKLSREVAYKLYFDLQGPCNETDKMNYKDPEEVMYKIPMGCHSHKLKDLPLFPTLDDLDFRTKHYTDLPLNLISPLETFSKFQGNLSLPESVRFSEELDQVMYGHYHKVMRSLSMIYTNRRVAVSEGFWRLQTKALIAILKNIEEQRKQEIAQRAKAATAAARTAANAAATAAATARPSTALTQAKPKSTAPSSVSVVDLVSQTPSPSSIPNGTVAGEAGETTVQLAKCNAPDASSINSESGSKPGDLSGKASSDAPPVDGEVTVIASSPEEVDQSQEQSAASITKTCDADKTKEAVAEEEESKEKEEKDGEEEAMDVAEEKEEKKEDNSETEPKKDEAEPEKKEKEKEEKKEGDEKEGKKNTPLVNGDASTHGDGGGATQNGISNGSPEGGSPLNGSATSDLKTTQSQEVQKGTKASSVEATPAPSVEPVNNIPNGISHASNNAVSGTVHTSSNGLNGTVQAPVNTPILVSRGVNNLPIFRGPVNGTGSIRVPESISVPMNGIPARLNGIPVQIGSMGNGRLGISGLVNHLVRNELQSKHVIHPHGGGVGSVVRMNGGHGLVISTAQNKLQLMSVPKLASSLGAVSAVAAVQNIPQVHFPKHVSLPTTRPIIAKSSTKTVPDKIAQFIKNHFVNIKPKDKSHFLSIKPQDTKYVPITVEALPAKAAAAARRQHNGLKPSPMQTENVVVSKFKTVLPVEWPHDAVQSDVTLEDPLIAKILKLTSALKQLHASKVLPEVLCKKIIPLCNKIALPSTPFEDKEEMAEKLHEILSAESKDALSLLDESSTDINANNNTIRESVDASEIPADMEKFLNSMTQRIKNIQNRLTARTIDPMTLKAIVPLCQDICDPKLPLTRKVECIKEAEERIKTAGEIVAPCIQAAMPIDSALGPDTLQLDKEELLDEEDEDDIVHFKLHLDDGTSIMVDMDSVEQAYEAVSNTRNPVVRLKRMSDQDMDNLKKDLKRKKVQQTLKRSHKGKEKLTPKQTQKGKEKLTPKQTKSGTKKPNPNQNKTETDKQVSSREGRLSLRLARETNVTKSPEKSKQSPSKRKSNEMSTGSPNKKK